MFVFEVESYRQPRRKTHLKPLEMPLEMTKI